MSRVSGLKKLIDSRDEREVLYMYVMKTSLMLDRAFGTRSHSWSHLREIETTSG